MKIKKRTPAYLFSFVSGDKAATERLESIRKMVSAWNKRGNTPRLRVLSKGRYGKNNPKYDRLRANTGAVPKADAAYFDVYINSDRWGLSAGYMFNYVLNGYGGVSCEF